MTLALLACAVVHAQVKPKDAKTDALELEGPKLRPIAGRFPGLIVRLDEGSANSIIKSMTEFLPHYLEYDLGINDLKEEWKFCIWFNTLCWDFTFTDF